MIPTSSKERKDAPVFSGFCNYWPLAMVEVARLSKFGNDKHNPGEPLHWARDKSDDHADCIVRHQLEYDERDEFGFYHAVAVAWRAMCQLELLLEGDRNIVKILPGQWVPTGSDYAIPPDTFEEDISELEGLLRAKAEAREALEAYYDAHESCISYGGTD